MRKKHVNQTRVYRDKKIPQDKLRNNALQLPDQCATRDPKTVSSLHEDQQRFREASETKRMLPSSALLERRQLAKT
jgi:hypothetical protein